jgi:hypothetical protein
MQPLLDLRSCAAGTAATSSRGTIMASFHVAMNIYARLETANHNRFSKGGLVRSIAQLVQWRTKLFVLA